MAIMFDRLGSLIARRWGWLLIGWAGLAVLVLMAAPSWDDVTCDGDFAYLPDQMSSVRGEKLLAAAFPDERSKSSVFLVLARRDGPLQPVDYAMGDRLAAQFTPETDNSIVNVVSYRTEVVGAKLRSRPGPEGQAALIVLDLQNEFAAVGNIDLIERIYGAIETLRHDPAFPAGLQLGVTGSAAIGSDMLLAAEESIRNIEQTTVILVILILLLVYRAPGLVIIPLVTILVSLEVATGLVAQLSQWSSQTGWIDYKIFSTTKIFIVVILYGTGTDFCLFLISRYREDLDRGLDTAGAVAHSLGRVGGAVAASAMTAILGLGAMACCEFGKFRNSGPTIALCLIVALLACLTLTPALLRAAGPLVFWPFGIRRLPNASLVADDRAADGSIMHRFWQRLGRMILARPGLILVGSLVVMAPLCYQGLRVDVTYDLMSELRSDRPSVEGTKLVRRYFSAGETGPVTVLAYSKSGGLYATQETREKLRRLSDDLYRFEYRDAEGTTVRPVTSVCSLSEPLGEPPRRFGFRDAVRKVVLRSHPLTKKFYLAQSPGYRGKVTRLDVVLRYDPFSAESIRVLDRLQAHLHDLARSPDSGWAGADFYYLGTTASIRDLKSVTSRDMTRIQRLVPITVLAVLIVILRRPVVCVYLVLSVLLGYFVSIGTTQLFFAWLYGPSFQGLDWKVPIFLFVILIAIGEDYNIYLVTRVVEEQKRLGAAEGLRTALVKTGGIITSCGIIMAGTFASMSTGTLRAVLELGVALPFGVLLDTCVIRPILVPAFLAIWDKRSARFGERYR
jgi:RND superfamily putative drug exporter